MKKFFTMLLLIFFVVIGSAFTFPEDVLDGSALQSAIYIQNNLDEINDYANSNGYSVNITHSYLQPILIFNGESYEEGYFIDFNDDNGYITVGNDFSIYDISFERESVAADGILNNFEFSIHDGYDYDRKIVETMDIETAEFYNPSNYDGTDSQGKITNLPDYVKDKYGSGYSLYAGKRVTTMSGERQSTQSVYIHYKDGIYYSEGNCGLISASNYLKYLYTNREFTNIPYNSYEYYYPQVNEVNLFNARNSDSSYTVSNPKYMRTALADIRREAYRINGGPEGLTVWESRDLLNHAMSRYGYSTRFKIIEIWSYSTVTSRINNNQALLWSVLGHNVYNDYTMFVSGYQTYKKEGKFLWWITYDYKEFFVLKDGHSSADRYYDFNGPNGNTWLGAFVVES